MKQSVNESEFIRAFDRMGRGDKFSVQGRVALFEFLENMEDSMETEFELDVIALCCEYTEYENIEEYNNDYGTVHESYEDIEETSVIVVDREKESFIIQSY